jgi:hypothetical protein
MDSSHFSSGRQIIAKRKVLVSELALKGHSVREIVVKLAEDQLNPKTGKPWARGTIHNDLIALKNEWEKEAQENFATRKATLMREMRRHRKEAWDGKNLSEVRLSIKEEAELIGAYPPKQFGIGGLEGGPIPIEFIPTKKKKS